MHLFGYLYEAYHDARPLEHKIENTFFGLHSRISWLMMTEEFVKIIPSHKIEVSETLFTTGRKKTPILNRKLEVI